MHTQGERPTPITKYIRSPGDYETHQKLIRRQPNRPERNYIELTPGMAVWVQHRQNTSWEPATVVSQSSSNSYWIMQENGTDQPRVYRRTRSMLKIRCTDVQQTRHNYIQLTEKAKFQTPFTSNEARNYFGHNSVEKISHDLVCLTIRYCFCFYIFRIRRKGGNCRRCSCTCRHTCTCTCTHTGDSQGTTLHSRIKKVNEEEPWKASQYI